jgi:hypothetical protein
MSIKVLSSEDDQFWAKSVIVEGARQVMLVDAQLTKTNAERVMREIEKTHKPLQRNCSWPSNVARRRTSSPDKPTIW